jgi:ribonucleotide monophosphatase NagD (HAD superfamily)
LLVTNDASRLPETNAARLQRFGVPVRAERVLSSGSLLVPWFARHNLVGARCVVLGSPDSVAYVRAAGGEIVAPQVDATVDVVVLADDMGFPFIETMNAVLSLLVRAFEAGRSPALLLPNPDILYPARQGTYGFTAGAMALMLEAALAQRFVSAAPRFTPLGKPSTVLFEEAFVRLGTRDAVMLGDQLHTDIAGARAAGIASALVLTGVASERDLAHSIEQPTYVIRSLTAA